MQLHGWDALPVNDGDGIRALATERELRRALEAGIVPTRRGAIGVAIKRDFPGKRSP